MYHRKTEYIYRTRQGHFQKITFFVVKILLYFFLYNLQGYKKVNFSCYRPGVAQRVGRGIALFFHDRGIRRG